jgi:hypothetical protein
VYSTIPSAGAKTPIAGGIELPVGTLHISYAALWLIKSTLRMSSTHEATSMRGERRAEVKVTKSLTKSTESLATHGNKGKKRCKKDTVQINSENVPDSSMKGKRRKIIN